MKTYNQPLQVLTKSNWWWWNHHFNIYADLISMHSWVCTWCQINVLAPLKDLDWDCCFFSSFLHLKGVVFFVSKRHFSSVFTPASRLTGSRLAVPAFRTGRTSGGTGSRAGAGRWCFSFFFNIYLINQLPTACCGGLLEQLHRFDLLVQYCNMCAWKPCQRIVTCCVLPFVFLLALLGRLVSVCFLYQCSFNRG